MIEEALEADELQVAAGFFLALFPGELQALEAELDVLADGAPGEQAVILEDGNATDGRGLDGLSVDLRTAARRPVEAREDGEQRALAAAGGAEQADEFAALDGEADVVEGGEVAALFRVDARDVLDGDVAQGVLLSFLI